MTDRRGPVRRLGAPPATKRKRDGRVAGQDRDRATLGPRVGATERLGAAALPPPCRPALFHRKEKRETLPSVSDPSSDATANPAPDPILGATPDPTEFEKGFALGLLVGEGSFGGDGKQPQVTLRMHTRHEAIFVWLMARFPRTRLYGPYTHGGRSYYQWMARGRTLVEDVLPLLEERLSPELDGHAAERLAEMTRKYAAFIARERARISAAGHTGEDD